MGIKKIALRPFHFIYNDNHSPLISKDKSCAGGLIKKIHGFINDHLISIYDDRYIFICLLALLSLGSFIRFFNIGKESIDLEEYACIGGISSLSWSSFWEKQKILYPYGAPLAPSLVYGWSRLFGNSIVTIRSLFALVSVVTLLLCWWMTQVFFPYWELRSRRRAGLVIVLCVALSPVHVFHAQEARMYALVSFFTILSMTALYRALSGNKTIWWFLHTLANIGLVSSHYFTVFLFPVQGLAVLLWERRVSKRVIVWSMVHGVILLLLLWWVSRIPRQADDLYSYYSLPSIRTILIHLFAGDSTVLSANSFAPSTLAWNSIFPTVARLIRHYHFAADGILIGFSLLALLWGIAQFFYRTCYNHKYICWTASVLLFWAILPTLLIVVISWAWQPIYGSRYVMYSVFAIYLLLGNMAAQLRRSGLFYSFLAALFLVYGYQLSLAFPAQTRTAWRQALNYVQTHSNDSPILLLEDPFWHPILCMNDDQTKPMPIVAAFSRETLCEAGSMIIQEGPSHEDVWVLLVLTTDFDETPFRECLCSHTLSYEVQRYPGERRLALYHIRRNTDQGLSEPVISESLRTLTEAFLKNLNTPEFALTLERVDSDLRYVPDAEGGFWFRLGIAALRHTRRALASLAFNEASLSHPTMFPEFMRLVRECHSPIISSTTLSGLLDAAIQIHGCSYAEKALQQYLHKSPDLLEPLASVFLTAMPDCPEGFAYMGLALHKEEKHQEAVSYFDRALAMGMSFPPELSEAYGISLAATGSYDQAINAFKRALDNFPEYHWLYMRLGNAYADVGNHVEAVIAYKKALEYDSNDFYLNYLLLVSLLALQHYEEALPFAKHLTIVNRNEPWVLLARWRAFCGTGDDLNASLALRQLTKNHPEFTELYDALYGNPSLVAAEKLLFQARSENSVVTPELELVVKRLRQKLMSE